MVDDTEDQSGTPSGVNSLNGQVGAVTLIGPSAVGSAPAGEVSPPAYRSDLPLSTTWAVDPAHGSDAKTNAGTSNATALRSLAQLAQRWWGAEIQANTTVTILGNLPSTDVPAWNFTVRKGVSITFLGSLGATTGFGGAAINNTLYSGTLTGAQATPVAASTNDTEIADTGIPVSYTGSGLLAAGVFFQTTSGAAAQWWALKDLGSKTLRISPPLNASVPQALTVGQNYSAYALWTIFDQRWPAAAAVNVNLQNLNDSGTTAQAFLGLATRRTNVWLGGRNLIEVVQNAINCAWFGGGAGGSIVSSTDTESTIYGGAWFGSWSATYGDYLVAAPFAFQGGGLLISDYANMTVEQVGGFYDSAGIAWLATNGSGRLALGATPFPAGGGFSGSGGTGKQIQVLATSTIDFWSGWTATPFVAGSTTDANSIQLGSTSYPLANVPFTAITRLVASIPFPLPADAGAAGAENYVSPTIDLTALATTQVVPARPGFVFLVTRGEWITDQVAGTVSAAPTVQFLSGATVCGGPTSAFPATTGFAHGGTSNAAPMASGSSAQFVSANAAISVQVTVAATGTGLTWKGRFMLSGSWVPFS